MVIIFLVVPRGFGEASAALTTFFDITPKEYEQNAKYMEMVRLISDIKSKKVEKEEIANEKLIEGKESEEIWRSMSPHWSMKQFEEYNSFFEDILNDRKVMGNNVEPLEKQSHKHAITISKYYQAIMAKDLVNLSATLNHNFKWQNGDKEILLTTFESFWKNGGSTIYNDLSIIFMDDRAIIMGYNNVHMPTASLEGKFLKICFFGADDKISLAYNVTLEL